jgi:hypothetical protein
MSRLRQVVCAICGTIHTKTIKQVNQAIKRKGRWACMSCMAGHNKVNLVGRRFGRLAVIADAGSVEYGDGKRSAWLCLCDCGGKTIATGNCLSTGKTKSCGCLANEMRGRHSKTHGMSETREYRIWQAMLRRCNNPKAVNYPDYGGRGISVCRRWTSFENFYADMGACPEDHSIERKDVDGIYEPGNCVWADRTTQCRNKRTNRLITFNGITKCLIEWANDLSIDQASLRERLERWTLEKALTTPKKGN